MPRSGNLIRLVATGSLWLAVVIGWLPAAFGQDALFKPVEPREDASEPAAAVAEETAVSAEASERIILARGPEDAPDTATKGEQSDEYEELILQALDQETNFEINEEVMLGDALKQLGDSTGIPIEVAPGTYDLLPYGSKTMLQRVSIPGRSLREGLTRLLEPICLEFEAQPRRVLVRPTPPLRRMVDRATWDELAMLYELQTTPFRQEQFDALSFQFTDAHAGDFETNRKTLLQLCSTVGEGTMARVLELACEQHGWSWYPEDEHIAVCTQTRMVERLLETRVSIRYVNTSLQDALVDLTQRAGVLCKFDPGVLASLPPQTAERFSIRIDNATVRQALEIVGGQTGLRYFIEPDGLRFAASSMPAMSSGMSDAPSASMSEAIRALKSNSIVGQVTFEMEDGSTFAFFLRENDLPPEVNEMRKAKIKRAVDDIRRKLFSEEPQD